jgi:hypothetical protein
MQLARMASTTLDNAVAAEAREANRLKDEFLGVLSHELRTPLQAIIAWMDILRQQPADAALRRQATEVVERSAQSQMRLIADLLDVSRIARGQLHLERETVELTAVVRLALETVQAMAASKRIILSFVPPGGDCRVDGDAARLQQVVWNLLSNAVKFTPEGGRVRWRWPRRGRADAARARQRPRHSGEFPATCSSVSARRTAAPRVRTADSAQAVDRPPPGRAAAATCRRPAPGAALCSRSRCRGRAAPRRHAGVPARPRRSTAARRASTDSRPARRARIDSREALGELLQCLGAEVRPDPPPPRSGR